MSQINLRDLDCVVLKSVDTIVEEVLRRFVELERSYRSTTFMQPLEAYLDRAKLSPGDNDHLPFLGFFGIGIYPDRGPFLGIFSNLGIPITSMADVVLYPVIFRLAIERAPLLGKLLRVASEIVGTLKRDILADRNLEGMIYKRLVELQLIESWPSIGVL